MNLKFQTHILSIECVYCDIKIFNVLLIYDKKLKR